MVLVYGKPDGFKNASSIAEGTFTNTDPGASSGIDAEIAGKFQGGICAGISTAWVIAFLAGSAEAKSTDGFLTYYENMLRFQGAYIFNYKAKQGVSTSTHGMNKFINPISELGVPANIRKVKEADVRVVGTSAFPSGAWGCYSVIPGHAIAFGNDGSTFYLMDPNYGLQTYDDKVSFITDLNYLYGAYRQCFREVGAPVTLFFYAQGMRARSNAFSM